MTIDKQEKCAKGLPVETTNMFIIINGGLLAGVFVPAHCRPKTAILIDHDNGKINDDERHANAVNIQRLNKLIEEDAVVELSVY